MQTSLAQKPSFKQLLTHRKFRRKLFVIGILTPIMIWFAIFMFWPLMSVVIYSFTNAKMQYSTYRFVGIEQYIKLLTVDPLVPVAFMNTLKAVLIIVPSVLILSVLLAAMLNACGKRAREAFTFIYFLPSVISMVAIALVWSWLYHPQYGLINAFLALFNIPPQNFIMDSGQALACICIVEIWYIFGYYAVILLAAMRGISPSLYEAADIDGAGPITKFFKIVIPMIKPNLIFVSIMSTISAFMLFTPVDVLTLGRGTPGTSTMVLMLLAKIQGIQQGDTAYASAISILLLVIILFVSLIQWMLSREGKRGGKA